MSREPGEMSEVTQDEYLEEYEKVLTWVRENPHLKKRAVEFGREYYDYVCRCAAALIAIVNTHALGQLPEDTDWEMYWGVQKGRSSKRRVALTMSLDDLRSIAGIRELAKVRSVRDLDRYLLVMWQSDTDGSDKDEETVNEYSLVTAYLVPFIDKMADSNKEYSYSKYGRKQERSQLIDQLMERFKD